MPDEFADIPSASAVELRMVRQLLGLTQARIANRLGISTRAIEEYESGRRPTPIYIREALQFVSMEVALERRNPKLTTDKTGQLADALSELRVESYLGDHINGWAISIGSGNVNGQMATYAWAVAVDDLQEAITLLAKRTPKPADGFLPIARLSQFTIARLHLRKGEACPL